MLFVQHDMPARYALWSGLSLKHTFYLTGVHFPCGEDSLVREV
jgi:hypothetical protein